MTPKFTLSKLLDHRSETKMESLESNGLLLPLINNLNVVDLPLITDNRAVRSVGPMSKARRTRTSSFHGKLDNVALCVMCKRTIEHWDTGLLQGVLGTLESQANHLWWSRGPAAETGSCRWALWSDYGCWHPGESASSPWSPVASQRSHVFGT